MTWHTVAAAEDEFEVLLGAIRREGGVITHSRRCLTGFLVTYVPAGTEPADLRGVVHQVKMPAKVSPCIR
jgi:hypothetical protein